MYVDLPDTVTLTKGQKEILGSVTGDVMRKVNRRKEKVKERSDNDVPLSEKTEEDMLRNKLARKLWESVSDSADCATVQSFEGDLSFLSTSDITNLRAEVVTECLTEFQDVEWEKDKLQAFGKKIKKGFGNNTSEWDQNKVMRAGKLLAGLDSEDLDKLTLDDTVIEVLGKGEIAEPQKMFKKFFEDAGISDVSKIDSDTLRGWGNMICGMNSSDMQDLDPKVIKDIITDLGSKDCLTDEQIDVISKKFGDSVSDKELESMDIEKIGVVVGRLDEDKLVKLKGEQLKSIPVKAIKKMKPDTFKKAFNSEKISKLTKEQVTALDPKVVRKMDVSQLLALENVEKGIKNINTTMEAQNRREQFSIALPGNVSVKSLKTFKEVRDLPQDACGGVSFAGQKERRLDSRDKLIAFNKSLSFDEAALFQRVLSNQDYDVSQFTTFDMKKTLQFLLNNLDLNNQGTFMDLKNEFSAIPADNWNDTVYAVPPDFYLIMKEDIMCEAFGQMDVESLEDFCERLSFDDVSTATFIEIINRCGDCLAAAHANRASEEMIALMNGFKGKAFYEKLRQWKPEDWDIYHLMFAPDSLERKDVNRVKNMDHFKDIRQLARLADPRFYMKLPRPVMEQISRKLDKVWGSFNGWPFIQKSMLLPYIVNMPPKILKAKLKASMVLSLLPNIDDLLDIGGKKFMTISAWKVANYLVKNAKSVAKFIKKQAFCMVLKYTNHKRLWNKVYSTSEVLDLLPSCATYKVGNKKMTNLVKRIITRKSFKWNQESLNLLGEHIAAVPISHFEKVDPVLLHQNWETLGKLGFSKNKLRKLWKIIKNKMDLEEMTCDGLQKLGKAILIMPSEQLEKIPDKAMGECARFIGELLEDTCKTRKRLCKRLWLKVKKYAKDKSLRLGEVIKALGKGFLQYIPYADVEETDLSDLGGIKNLAEFETSQDKAPILMGKVKQILGPVRLDNANYSSEAVKQIGAIFYYGATASEFEILPEDSSLLDMLVHMSKYFKDLNEKKIEVVFKKLKKIFAVDSSSNICLDRALVEQIAMFFTAARPGDLRKFSDDTRKVIFETIGKKYDYVNTMSRSKIKDLFSVLMETDSMSSKASLGEEDVGKYKYMWCGQTSSEAKRLSEEAVDSHMGTLKDCAHYDTKTRESLVKRSIDVSGDLTTLLTENPKRLEDLGSLIIDIDVDQLKSLDSDSKDVFISNTQKVMESVTAVQEQVKERPSGDISANEKTADELKLKRVGRIIFEMHLTTSDGNERRRKRATKSVDCATLQDFNGALSFLEPSAITSMDNSEFQDCLAEFQKTSWTDAQLEAFKTQLIASFGSDTSTWTQNNILAAGILLDALTPSQILNITVIDDDTISTLGSEVFTKNAGNILTAYMTSQSITDLSKVNADSLANVGNLVCGFNTSEINKLEPSSIDGASSELSTVPCLQSDQLEQLGNKIVENRGTDWTSTTAHQISALGVLVGGLPPSVLEDLGEDELSSISPKAIESLSPDTFATVFTADKIILLSSAQANVLTQEQKNELSPEQMTAVTIVATTASDDRNGSSHIQINLTVTLLVVLVTFILK